MAKAVGLRVLKGQGEHSEASSQVESAGVGRVSAHFLTFSFSPHSGIECPRGARNLPGLVQEGEPFSEEATLFTKELVLQREVGRLHVASYAGEHSPTPRISLAPAMLKISRPSLPLPSPAIQELFLHQPTLYLLDPCITGQPPPNCPFSRVAWHMRPAQPGPQCRELKLGIPPPR